MSTYCNYTAACKCSWKNTGVAVMDDKKVERCPICSKEMVITWGPEATEPDLTNRQLLEEIKKLVKNNR